MKRMNVFVVILFFWLLTACTPSEQEPIHLNIMVPIGTPALTQTHMQSTMPSLGEHVTYEIETVFGTDPLVAAFGSHSYDIIFAPTNLGAKLISTGVDYMFAGTVVMGNLYLASTGYDTFSLDDLEGKTIVAFGQNATPDVVLQVVLNAHQFEISPTITYVDSVSTAQAMILQDPETIVLMAEPALSVLGLPSNLGEDLDIIDLQEEWDQITGNPNYPQAGVFVKSDIDIDVLDAYLRALQDSIDMANQDPSLVAQMAVELEYGFPEAVLITAIPRSNLAYLSAIDSQVPLERYFQYILDWNPALIGGALPDSTFYYNGEES